MSHRTALAFAVLFVGSSSSAVAAAQSAPSNTVPMAPQHAAAMPRDSGPEEPRLHWYGWQTLTADGASLVLLATGLAATSAHEQSVEGRVLLVGAAGAYAAPPVIHAVHGNFGRGALSLGLRAGLPLGAAYLGASAEDCRHSDSETCGLGGAALGIFAGWSAAVAIDAAALSWEPETAPTATPTAIAPTLTDVAVTPVASNGDASLAVSVGGVW